MGFAQFLSILRARWVVAVAVLGIAILTALGLSLVLPKQYVATASVVIDVKPDPIAGVLYPGLLIPGYIATQVDVLTSDRVALRVVRNLKLAENPTVRQQWLDSTKGEGSIEQWLIDTFSKQLDVKPSRESNVINVSYRARDPRFAAALANAFVQAYLDTTIELRVDPAKQYSSFFDVRAKEARDALEKAQNKLSAFQKEKGIIVTDERLDVENFRLNELSAQLVAVQSMTADSSSRQAAAGGSGDKMQEVLNNPVIANLKSDLSRAEAQFKQLNARLGDANPQVIEARANIAELRSRLDAETKRIMGGVGVSNTINRQREAQLRADLEAQRSKILQMRQIRDEGALLVKDVDNAQRAWDAVSQRLTQTSLESQTTQSNANLLTQATPPLQPASPKPVLNTLLAAAIGLLLGIGAVIALELLDRRVRVLDDLQASLGLPVIGVMPSPSAKRSRSARRGALPMMQQRLLPGLPGGNRSE
jgi:chain length determinant protein EpsF